MGELRLPPGSKLVLFVEDDDGIRELIGMLIEKHGFRLITAASGEEAIERLSQKPDAILLDLVMPGCGGAGVLNHLKGLPGPVPPVLVVTAYGDRDPRVTTAMMDPNVVQCLPKPINTHLLLQALHRYLKTDPLENTGQKPSVNP